MCNDVFGDICFLSLCKMFEYIHTQLVRNHVLKLLKSIFRVMVGFTGCGAALLLAMLFSWLTLFCFSLTAASRRGFRLVDILITALKCSGYSLPTSVRRSREQSLISFVSGLACEAVTSSSRNATRIGMYSAIIVTPDG
ncbi:hypothetical protein EGW08_004062 [Elysia chlorotica]|uniref:Uncharacterized protein n=1 Tax=Elysia chlorotica TaxID=188477 RepID=A0A433U2Y4_ELYCH|nr:hypothetical protein EGW08_004062 [Elysia chlorotica]